MTEPVVNNPQNPVTLLGISDVNVASYGSLAANAEIFQGGDDGTAANDGLMAIINPSDSGKVITVLGFVFHNGTNASEYQWGISTEAVLDALSLAAETHVKNLNTGSLVAQEGELSFTNIANVNTSLGADEIGRASATGSKLRLDLSATLMPVPIVLTAGFGFWIGDQTAGGMRYSMIWKEEDA